MRTFTWESGSSRPPDVPGEHLEHLAPCAACLPPTVLLMYPWSHPAPSVGFILRVVRTGSCPGAGQWAVSYTALPSGCIGSGAHGPRGARPLGTGSAVCPVLPLPRSCLLTWAPTPSASSTPPPWGLGHGSTGDFTVTPASEMLSDEEARVLTPAALGHGPGRPMTEWPSNEEYMCQVWVPWVKMFLCTRTGSPVRAPRLFTAGWMAGVV